MSVLKNNLAQAFAANLNWLKRAFFSHCKPKIFLMSHIWPI